MKLKLLLIIITIGLFSLSCFAQDSETSFEVGSDTRLLLRSGKVVNGVSLSFTDKKTHLYIPIRINFANGLHQETIGVGFKADISKKLKYAINMALTNINNDDIQSMLLDEDKQRVAILIENEINYQISKRFSLGVNVSLDPGNFQRVSNAGRKTYVNQTLHNQYTGAPYTINRNNADFQTKEERDYNLQSKKNSSLASFGLTLKFNIFK